MTETRWHHFCYFPLGMHTYEPNIYNGSVRIAGSRQFLLILLSCISLVFYTVYITFVIKEKHFSPPSWALWLVVFSVDSLRYQEDVTGQVVTEKPTRPRPGTGSGRGKRHEAHTDAGSGGYRLRAPESMLLPSARGATKSGPRRPPSHGRSWRLTGPRSI